MKTLTCAQMGGMCEEKIQGETQDEMLGKGMQHVKDAHPEMAKDISSMPADHPAMVEWSQKFDETWAAAPEE